MSLDLTKGTVTNKIRLLYFPLFTIAVVFIVVYTCFGWYWIANGISVREDTIHVWLPSALPWIPLIIWLRPRIRLLDLKRKKGDLPTLYLIVAAATIIAPAIITQKYLSSATGKLTRLRYINEIGKKKPTKYYTIDEFFVDHQLRGINYISKVTGKYNSQLDLYIYIACPIYSTNEMDEPTKIGVIAPPLEDMSKGGGVLNSPDTSSRTLDGDSLKVASRAEQKSTNQQAADDPPPIINIPAPKAWLCMNYYKHISNRLSEEEKKTEYHTFYHNSLEDFRQKNLRGFTYLVRLGNNKTRDCYADAIKKVIFLNSEKDPVILEAVNEPFELRNGHKLEWIFLSFLIGSVVWLVMIIIAPFKEEEPENYLQSKVYG